MTEPSFLPEDDQDFLRLKAIKHRLHSEQINQDVRRGIEILDFEIPPNLYQRRDGRLVAGGMASVLVLIPWGYAKARLDSWYVRPGLFHANGNPIDRAGSDAILFGETWQFWSRHLVESEWRPDTDGIETYIQYIRAEFRNS
jgi:Prokaryotic E2 family E